MIGDEDALSVLQLTMLLHWDNDYFSRSSAVYLSPSNSIRNSILCDQSRDQNVSCLDLSGPDFYMNDSMFMFTASFNDGCFAKNRIIKNLITHFGSGITYQTSGLTPSFKTNTEPIATVKSNCEAWRVSAKAVPATLSTPP